MTKKKTKHPPIHSLEYLFFGSECDRICIHKDRFSGLWAVEGHGGAIEFIDTKDVGTFEEAWEIAEEAAARYQFFKILEGLR